MKIDEMKIDEIEIEIDKTEIDEMVARIMGIEYDPCKMFSCFTNCMAEDAIQLVKLERLAEEIEIEIEKRIRETGIHYEGEIAFTMS